MCGPGQVRSVVVPAVRGARVRLHPRPLRRRVRPRSATTAARSGWLLAGVQGAQRAACSSCRAACSAQRSARRSQVLPFDDIVPWDSFVVRVPLRRARETLLILSKLSPARVAAMHDALVKYRGLLLWERRCDLIRSRGAVSDRLARLTARRTSPLPQFPRWPGCAAVARHASFCLGTSALCRSNAASCPSARSCARRRCLSQGGVLGSIRDPWTAHGRLEGSPPLDRCFLPCALRVSRWPALCSRAM